MKYDRYNKDKAEEERYMADCKRPKKKVDHYGKWDPPLVGVTHWFICDCECNAFRLVFVPTRKKFYVACADCEKEYDIDLTSMPPAFIPIEDNDGD